MAKHGKGAKRPVADWEVRHKGGTETIASARYERDKAGGYTFWDKGHLLWEFPPGVVLWIRPAILASEPADPGPIEVGKP